MKLIMAVSKDGYVARNSKDDMSWTGPFDKAAFRMLTCVGGTIACGSKTWELMPKNLAGRHMVRLSTKPIGDGEFPEDVFDLAWFNQAQPNGWLIGGLAIAVNALGMDLVEQAFICESDRRCFPADGEGESAAPLGIMLKEGERTGKPRFLRGPEIKIGDCTVHVYNRAA